ncbi:MAG: flagellar export chaperone FliS [Acidobacteriaceae bacterium]
MGSIELSYRKTSVAGASGFGILLALYDTLASDLHRAAEAERNNRIEERCRAGNHALLVIAHLQEWVQRSPGGKLSDQLQRFYSSLRRKLIQAQAMRSADLMEQQMAEVLRLRAIWQQMEMQGAGCQDPDRQDAGREGLETHEPEGSDPEDMKLKEQKLDSGQPDLMGCCYQANVPMSSKAQRYAVAFQAQENSPAASWMA